MKANLHIDDAALVEECKSGDRDAMSALYERYSSRMLHIIRRYVNDDAACHDILHDGFIVAFTRLDNLRSPERFEYWLATIMKNLSLKFLQSQDIVTILHEIPDMAEDDTVEDIVDWDVLETLISKLPTGYQKVFRLAVLENKTHKEISEILGIAPNSSSSQLFHAKLYLRKLINEYKIGSGLVSILLLGTLSVLILKSILPVKQHNRISTDHIIASRTDDMPTADEKHPSAASHSGQNLANGTSLTNKPEKGASSSSANGAAKVSPSDTVNEEVTNPHDSTKEEITNLPEEAPTYSGDTNPTQTLSVDSVFITENDFDHLREYAYESLTTNPGRKWCAGLSFSPNIAGFNPERYMDLDTALPPEQTEAIAKQPHKNLFPVSVAFTIQRELMPFLGIETGIGYNYLHSIFQAKLTKTDCKWHYVEIPLKINLSYYHDTRVNLYGSIKADLNIPVYSRVYIAYNSFDPSLYTQDGRFTSYPIFSIGCGIGASIHLYKNLDLYFEPTLKYHFKNKDVIPNAWKDQQFNVSVPIGLRLKW